MSRNAPSLCCGFERHFPEQQSGFTSRHGSQAVTTPSYWSFMVSHVCIFLNAFRWPIRMLEKERGHDKGGILA